jgi:hypothetical protein
MPDFLGYGPDVPGGDEEYLWRAKSAHNQKLPTGFHPEVLQNMSGHVGFVRSEKRHIPKFTYLEFFI